MKLFNSVVYIFLSYQLLVVCYESNSDQQYLDTINASWVSEASLEQDEAILALFRLSFEKLEHNKQLSGCEKCKSRLGLGKILALNKPYLIPSVYMEWCLRKGYKEVDCRIRFNRKEINHIDNFTSDFANILQLMNVFDSDGDWFCYYHDDECNVKPEVPEDVDDLMRSWYPTKPYDKLYPPESMLFDSFHILQLSDLDYQIDYHIGAEANCSQEICCIHCGFNERKLPTGWNIGGHSTADKYQLSYYNGSYDDDDEFHKGPYVDVTLPSYKGTWDPAHEFGSYQCGSPELLINNTFKTAAMLHQREDIDFDFLYVLFNGGFQVRSNNFDETVNSEVKMLHNLKHFFGFTPIITTLGKHDTYPDSQIAQYLSGKSKEFSWNEELYGDLLLDFGWIENNQFRSIKTHNGAYSIITEYGLKIISLNSNLYNTENYYCFWNTTHIDTFGQIQFLVNELVESEQNDQRVWIMSSLPLNSPKVMPFQLRILTNIIKRFSPATIAEIFFGDSHQDSYTILYDEGNCEEEEEEEVPIAGAWIAPSISPLHGNNPGFRYYEVDSRTFSVLNAYTYYTPLDKTYVNSGDEPEWNFLYSTRESYSRGEGEEFWPLHLPLNATFWDKVLNKRISDKLSYKQLYQDNKFKLSPYTPDCSEEMNYATCELAYCEILSFTFENYEACISERYPALYEKAFPISSNGK